MGKVDIGIAREEVLAWLKYKKVDSDKITEKKEEIDSLASAISAGHLVLNQDDFTFTQTLKFPIGEGDACSELIYKPRLKMSDIKARTKHVKGSDSFGLITAYVCALTSQNSGIIDELDSEDNKVAQAIAVFFL